MSEKKREKWIDNAKGIAILLVVLAHVDVRFSFAYGFHLVVFFVLSGYTLKTESVSKTLINKKFRRLMTPYFYTCLAVMAMDVVNAVLVYHKASIESVTQKMGNDLIRSYFASGSIKEFGSIEIGCRIGAIWFLPALFISILLCQLIIWYIDNDLKAGAASVGIALIGMITARFIWLPFSIQSAMFAVPFIWAGYEARHKELLKRLRWHHYLIAQIILIIGIRLGFSELWFVTAGLKDVFLSPLIGFSGCLIVIMVAKLYKGNALAYLGKQSLVIMCAHLLALETLGAYFAKLLDMTGLTGVLRGACGDLLQIAFPVLVAAAIDRINRAKSKRKMVKPADKGSIRDDAVDVVKGICIILMVIGHYIPAGSLRTIIFSFHMMAFVFFSGYFYNSKRSVPATIKRMSNSFLKPYVVAAILAILLVHDYWNAAFIREKGLQYILGMSFSDRWFTGIDSVGPIYFILLLFAVRLLYLAIDHTFNKDYMKWIAVIGLTLLGIKCGANGYWLPWSFDVACYALVFYKTGVLFREKELLPEVNLMPILYFVLSSIWAFMIYSGGMEIAVRNYGQFGLTIIGSICGIMLVYMLSSFILNNIRKVGELLAIIGRASLYILIVHTVFRGIIDSFVSRKWDPLYLPYLAVTLIVQVTLAVIGYYLVGLIKGSIRSVHYSSSNG